MIHQNTRSGATLTEVLVAIFVMAIGLLALLTLFPLGALSMAQAIKDGRTAQSSKNAFAIAEAYNTGLGGYGAGIHNDLLVLNNSSIVASIPPNATTYFLNPYPGIPQLPVPPQPVQFLAPDLFTISNAPGWTALSVPGVLPYDGPSYPIYVDAFGSKNFGLGYLGNIPAPTAPGVGISTIPRQPLSGLLTNQWLDRWCTLSDDITFQENGTPSTNTGTVQRENRYTWAWLLRRPKAFDPSVVDVTVVVYSGRSLTSLGETPFFPVAFDPSSKFVDITYSGTKPSIRTGSWILDATMEYFESRVNPLINPVGNPLNVPDPHGFFYRVVGVTDVNSTTLRLELQTYPKRRSFIPPNPGIPGDPGIPPYGVLIVMENVVEVFEKGPGWQP